MNRFFFVILLILTACTSSEIREPAADIEIYFCPQDKCVDRIIEKIDSSLEIKCAFYELNIPELIEKLKEKNADVIIEDSTSKGEFKTGYSFALMHNKFCVFDNRTIMTGSMNPTERGNYYNNNNIVFIESEHLSKNYLDEFEELEKGIYGEGEETGYPVIFSGETRIENYFCPEDNCKLRVINTLLSANESIYFMAFSFTDEDLANLLWNKDYQGIDVKGIVEKRQAGGYSRYEDLKDFAILDSNPYTMHHKAFIVDRKVVITGSYNPTQNANENNDENILIIHDREIAGRFLEEFERVYSPEEIISDSNLVFGEIVYDVPGSDTGKEYAELKNMGSKTIDLGYYFLSNNKTNTRLSGDIHAGQTIIVRPKFGLKNSNGMLMLKKHNSLVDVVFWE